VRSGMAARTFYCFERVSEVLVAALCATLCVSLLVEAGSSFSAPQHLPTIEEQYAMSWSMDERQP
jgi:hypothetical protein